MNHYNDDTLILRKLAFIDVNVYLEMLKSTYFPAASTNCFEKGSHTHIAYKVKYLEHVEIPTPKIIYFPFARVEMH